jgi:hypothetical protein
MSLNSWAPAAPGFAAFNRVAGPRAISRLFHRKFNILLIYFIYFASEDTAASSRVNVWLISMNDDFILLLRRAAAAAAHATQHV